MADMGIRYVKRFQMIFDFHRVSPPAPDLPEGFHWVPWKEELLETHARVKHEGFRDSMDAVIFPTFACYESCLRLMESIAGGETFEPKATWLIAHDVLENVASRRRQRRYIANIQGILLEERYGKIQNVTVLPGYRGRGFGRLLVAGCLHGFRAAGVEKVALEVTADNYHAVRLYEHLGFRTSKVVFKESYGTD